MSEQKTSDVLGAILDQYEDGKKTTFNNNKDLKNYLSTRLPEGETSGVKKIRILPPQGKETTPFSTVYIHKIKVGDYWRKYMCPQETLGKPCPFCDTNKALRASDDDEKKTLAKDYSPRKAYIARVIDRDNEGEGVKFWRFNHDYRGEGIFDKIIGVFKAKGDISHPREGRDLTMDLGKNKKGATLIKGFIHEDIGLLTDNAEKAKSWLNTEKTWRDVYDIKSYDYLSLIVNNKQPVWSKELEKYVDRDELDQSMSNEVKNASGKLESELTYGAGNTQTAPTEPQTTSNTDVDDDLPF